MLVTLKPGQLSYKDLKNLSSETATLKLDPACYAAIAKSVDVISNLVQANKTVYGINTGFGALATTRIDAHQLEDLQRSLLLSHAAGTSENLSNEAVRLIQALKINCLAQGYSGVRRETIDALVEMYNHKIYPCIPSKGSVGASGDLAPLAHLSIFLLGIGNASFEGKVISAKEGLERLKLKPFVFSPKEGLALINGTQVSTALALLGLFHTETLFVAAITAGAFSVDVTKGTPQPFDERIQALKGHAAQKEVAKLLRALLKDSLVRESHQNCEKVQDPYSLRCQPQVMGACLAQMKYCQSLLVTEANGVSDNPLVFAEKQEVLSGGNFHAEFVGFAADALAVAIAEIGALSERRIALLTDARFSGLPPFLAKSPGIHSGFMLAHVTATSLASENKTFAHPASVDSLPTSANQEDHVSMATFASRRLMNMAENSTTIVAIELLATCQALDFLRPLKTSNLLENVYKLVRKEVAFYDEARYFAPDIEKIKNLIQTGKITETVAFNALN